MLKYLSPINWFWWLISLVDENEIRNVKLKFPKWVYKGIYYTRFLSLPLAVIIATFLIPLCIIQMLFRLFRDSGKGIINRNS